MDKLLTVPEEVALLPLDGLIQFMISLIPVGLGVGMLMLLIGLGISGVMKIFKKV